MTQGSGALILASDGGPRRRRNSDAIWVFWWRRQAVPERPGCARSCEQRCGIGRISVSPLGIRGVVPLFGHSRFLAAYESRNEFALKAVKGRGKCAGNPGQALRRTLGAGEGVPSGPVSRLPADGDPDLYPLPTPPEAKHKFTHVSSPFAARLPRPVNNRVFLNKLLKPRGKSLRRSMRRLVHIATYRSAATKRS